MNECNFEPYELGTLRVEHNDLQPGDVIEYTPMTEIYGQKKRHSFIEAVVSTVIGLVINLFAGAVIYPFYGITAARSIFAITAIFTVISVIRGFYVRRLFNYLHRKTYL